MLKGADIYYICIILKTKWYDFDVHVHVPVSKI